MRKTIGFAALALAACNKGPEVKVENATPAEVAAKVQQSGVGEVSIEPGQWQVVSEIKLAELKGMPQGVAAQMRASMERKSTDLECVTPEQVKKPEMFAGKQNNSCKYERFEMSGGKLNAVMHCPAGEGGAGQMTMTMTGSYTPRSYTVDATMGTNSAAGQGMKMAMHATGTRVGECPAGGATDQ